MIDTVFESLIVRHTCLLMSFMPKLRLIRAYANENLLIEGVKSLQFLKKYRTIYVMVPSYYRLIYK